MRTSKENQAWRPSVHQAIGGVAAGSLWTEQKDVRASLRGGFGSAAEGRQKDGPEKRVQGHTKTRVADPEGWPRVRGRTELAGVTRHTAGLGLSASPLRG